MADHHRRYAHDSPSSYGTLAMKLTTAVSANSIRFGVFTERRVFSIGFRLCRECIHLDGNPTRGIGWALSASAAVGGDSGEGVQLQRLVSVRRCHIDQTQFVRGRSCEITRKTGRRKRPASPGSAVASALARRGHRAGEGIPAEPQVRLAPLPQRCIPCWPDRR